MKLIISLDKALVLDLICLFEQALDATEPLGKLRTKKSLFHDKVMKEVIDKLELKDWSKKIIEIAKSFDLEIVE